VGGEAGGITQHIGAYQIERRGRKITFIDTPGHEAFTAMRSRGARVADIAILVVAANDGVMPQTEEAIKIAEASGIPIVVAINKIDLPEANVEKTKQELMKFNLLPEEWGGKTVCVPISAKQGLHIDELLDQVLLVADIESSKMIANPEGELVGTIIESHVDKGFGPVATVLVQNGTLHKGDMLVVAGNYFGHIRAMYDYNSQEILTAPPATPAQIVGLKVTPKVGDMIAVTQEKMKQARSHQFEKRGEVKVHKSSEDNEDDDAKVQLNIILRTDVLGSQEAIMESLEKIDSEGVKLKFVQVGLGNITESDVLQADATGALLLGFNVVPSNQARSLAREKKVEIKTYRIIYELIDNVKDKLNELILPELLREEMGQLLVLKVFKKENKKMVLGCRVQKGRVEKNSLAAALRDGQFVVRGKIIELQVGKEPVVDVMQGQECGICFEAAPLVEEQDILEIYREREVKKTIK
jgi:translation initiation factor IF-2